MKKRLFLALLVVIIIVIAVLWWRENRTLDAPVQKVTADTAQIERGRYLVQASDCAACHTASGGAPLAGGYPLETPFGKIFGSNLTPSADDGIGRWTSDDFYLALTKGVAPGGRHLYPAMPYTSYKGVTRKDSDDMYAFLMTRPAVDQPVPENEMPFPFNQRSECHTPRGKLGQMDTDSNLRGGTLGRITAPAITPESLAQRGWNPADLSRFLATGIAPQGSAFDEMHKVVDLSTRHLTDADHRAIVTYLLGDKPPAAVPVSIGQGGNDAGRITYLDQCSGCHMADGSGKPHVAVAMQNNATLRQPDGRNLIVSVLDGLPAQDFPNGESMQSMPGFADRLNDAQIAEMVNYLRVTFGGLPGNISADQVKALRKH